MSKPDALKKLDALKKNGSENKNSENKTLLRSSAKKNIDVDTKVGTKTTNVDTKVETNAIKS